MSLRDETEELTVVGGYRILSWQRTNTLHATSRGLKSVRRAKNEQ